MQGIGGFSGNSGVFREFRRLRGIREDPGGFPGIPGNSGGIGMTSGEGKPPRIPSGIREFPRDFRWNCREKERQGIPRELQEKGKSSAGGESHGGIRDSHPDPPENREIRGYGWEKRAGKADLRDSHPKNPGGEGGSRGFSREMEQGMRLKGKMRGKNEGFGWFRSGNEEKKEVLGSFSHKRREKNQAGGIFSIKPSQK